MRLVVCSIQGLNPRMFWERAPGRGSGQSKGPRRLTQRRGQCGQPVLVPRASVQARGSAHRRHSVGTGRLARVTDEGPTGLLHLPRRDLGRRFSVERLPAVVVLKPGGDVLTLDAVDEIQRLGPACFANWQEAAEVLDRSFLQPEDLDDPAPRSLTEPLRRCKYRVDRAARGSHGREREGCPRREDGAEELF